MNWLDRLEKKYPRFGIPNITLYLVVCNAIGYLLSSTVALNYLHFDVYHILHGQLWRLVSWIFIPKGGSVITMFIFLLLAASWGRSLETMMGTFRTSVFVIGGVILYDVLGFATYFGTGAILRLNGLNIGVQTIMGASGFGFSPYYTTYFLILTILMQIALLHPDAQVMFWFILPMRMKWMFWIMIAELAYETGATYYSIFTATQYLNYPKYILFMEAFVMTASTVFALLNLLIFYLASKNHLNRQQRQRRNQFRSQFAEATPRPGSGITRHKCAVCGRTEVSNPELEFRYCSKCPGGYEYCNEHLFTHIHR